MRSRWSLLAALLILPAAAHAQEGRRPIRLVLSLAVDQLRPIYLERWRDQYTGGLARLLREGVFFPHAEQDHAITETAPGHSTMLSGRSPASTGILSNDLGVPDPGAPLIGSTATGASPRRFIGTTLADWMRAEDSATRVLSISRKDRGAILPIGRQVAPIFWYSRGRFTTSKYYGAALPDWLIAWNDRDPIGALAGSSWELGRDPSSYPEPDDRPFEAGGNNRTFPHRLPEDWTMASGEIEHHSVMDSLTLDVALAGVAALGLGQRSGTDLLAISLSTTDNVGHRWGSGSREIHDHLLNLDRWLGWFLDSLARSVPLDQVVISLTSDHGVVEFPEAGKGGRTTLSGQVRALNRLGTSRWGINLEASAVGGLMLAETGALRARGVNVDSLAEAVAIEVRALPGVRRVFTPRTLRGAPAGEVEAGRWRRQIGPDVEWLVAVALLPDWTWTTGKNSTGHGSTNPDDVQVPLLFRVPGVAPATVPRRVRTIDIGPTLARVIDVRPTEPVEGVILPEALRGRSPR